MSNKKQRNAKPTGNPKPTVNPKPTGNSQSAQPINTPGTAPTRKVPVPAKKGPNIYMIVGAVAIVALFVGLFVLRSSGSNSILSEAKRFTDLGQGLHLQTIDDELPVPFNSNPPTSGYHVGSMLSPWGIQKEPVSDKVSTHNIEHGGVIIHYKQSLDADSVAKLDTLARDLQRRNQCLLMSPRPDDQIEHPVVVTAWTYMLTLDSVDTTKITHFFEELVGKGPEKFCTPLS
jgi:hypothetical protein